MTTVLIAGATGMLGSRIAHHLTIEAPFREGGDHRLPVRPGALTDETKKGTVDELVADGAVVVEGDLFDQSSLVRATQGVDVVVSAVQGGKDILVDGQVALARAAQSGGVRRFIASDFAIDLFHAPAGAPQTEGTTMSNLHSTPGSELLTPDGGYALRPADAPAWWAVGTYRRLLSTTTSSTGRSSTFDELVPPGIVAPPHVHDHEEEAFFVLEGDLAFWLREDEIEAPPGTYVYIPPGTQHGFRCNSSVGRVYNTLAPGGFDDFLSSHATPAPRLEMPPPGVSAIDVWRHLDPQRPRAPWEDEGFDPTAQVQT